MSIHEIAVVGAGVVGLSCAIRLREQGHSVAIYAERRTPNTTSDRAGAVFSPFRMDGHPAAARWTQASYRMFAQLAEHDRAATGVSMTTLRELFFSPLAALPWWAEFVENVQRSSDVAPPYVESVSANVPKMDMRRYLPWLHRRFTADPGGRIVTEKLASYESLFDRNHHVVVNCSGLGARELASDTAVTPRRGQIVHLPPLAGVRECIVEESRGDIATYVFPFDEYTVLGGTYERDEWTEDTRTCDLDAIVDRCRRMLVACGHSPTASFGRQRIRAVAGLRPSRALGGSDESVRLEIQEISRGRYIIHNYGHGRAGVTLSWGCAEEVARLVEATCR